MQETLRRTEGRAGPQHAHAHVSSAHYIVRFPKDDVELAVPTKFERIVACQAERVAVQTAHETLSYDALNRAANRLARAILAHSGAGDAPIAYVLEPGALPIVALLAILKAGRAYVPLDPINPLQRLAAIADDAAVALILSSHRHSALAQQVAREARPVLNLETLDGTWDDSNLALDIAPDRFAALLYTSGSSGTPKGAIATHRKILHEAMLDINSFELGPDDHQALLMSSAFEWSLSVIFGTLLSGGALYPLDFRALGLAGLATWLRTERISIVQLIPSLLRQIMDASEPPDEQRFQSLRLVAVSGEPLTQLDVQRWKQHFAPHCVLVNEYGTTEAGHISWYFITRETQVGEGVVPIGYAAQDKQILLLDERNEPVPTGVVGQLAVRTRYMVAGYWNQPARTQAVFLPDARDPLQRIYLSGDFGRMRADGCFEYVGRKDFQVKVRGQAVQLDQIETALYEVPSVRQVSVIAREDKPGKQQLVAYVVPADEHLPTVHDLRAALVERVPAHMIPTTFVFMQALPLTPNGKVNRTLLPAPNQTRPRLETPYVKPRDALESELAQLWEDVLNVRPIGIRDDFFELGGDSLSAVSLAAALEKHMGKPLRPATLLSAPTIETLAAVLAPTAAVAPPSSIVPIQTQGARPPLFVAHGIGAGAFDFRPLARRLGCAQPVYALESALGAQYYPPSFAALVTRYLEELLAFQPQGPYWLAGHSYGGAVVYELAQQLQQRGQHVALLAMFDYTPVADYWRFTPSPRTLWRFAHNLPHWLAGGRRLGVGIAMRIAQRRLSKILTALRAGSRALEKLREPEAADFLQAADQIAPDYLNFWQHHLAILKQHTFRPYDGRVTLFRAQAQPLFCSFDPQMRWDQLARGGVEVHVVPGAHHDMLLEPQVRVLAAELQRCLARASST